jgi:hypothetical protein
MAAYLISMKPPMRLALGQSQRRVSLHGYLDYELGNCHRSFMVMTLL